MFLCVFLACIYKCTNATANEWWKNTSTVHTYFYENWPASSTFDAKASVLLNKAWVYLKRKFMYCTKVTSQDDNKGSQNISQLHVYRTFDFKRPSGFQKSVVLSKIRPHLDCPWRGINVGSKIGSIGQILTKIWHYQLSSQIASFRTIVFIFSTWNSNFELIFKFDMLRS